MAVSREHGHAQFVAEELNPREQQVFALAERALEIADMAFSDTSDIHGVCGNDTGKSVAIIAAALIPVLARQKKL